MKRRYIVGLLGLSSVAGLAFAPRASTIPFQYRVKIYEGQTLTHTEVLNGGTGWSRAISNSVTRINIEPDNSDTNIGRLTFTGGNSQNVDVILGTGTSLGLGVDPVEVGNNWAGLDTSGGSATFRLYGGITGNLTDSILVEQLDRFDADGAIQALVQADDPYLTHFKVFANSVSGAGSIVCVDGAIDRVEINNNCNGSITAAGAIDAIVINGGLFANIDTSGILDSLNVDDDIGTTIAHVSINALQINNIAADAIFADIVADASGSNGRVRRIETRGVGDFDGSLSLREFHEIGGTGTIELDILGDLNADVTFTKQVNSLGAISIAGDLAADATIDIFRHLTGDITIGAGGLKGQIIANSGDVGSIWTGTVTVGSTVLTGVPTYTQIGLGGGTVGVVGFDCYKFACTPAYTSSTRPEMSGDFSVTLRHYGPVKWTSGMPVKIEFCVNASCGTWADRSSFFDATLSADARNIVITPSGDTTAIGEYRISPITTGDPALKCDGITATTDPLVASYRYDVKYNG